MGILEYLLSSMNTKYVPHAASPYLQKRNETVQKQEFGRPFQIPGGALERVIARNHGWKQTPGVKVCHRGCPNDD